MLDGDLADWIDRTVAFPSSVVYRITPVTTQADRDLLLLQGWGALWVLEDRFTDGRPRDRPPPRHR